MSPPLSLLPFSTDSDKRSRATSKAHSRYALYSCRKNEESEGGSAYS